MASRFEAAPDVGAKVAAAVCLPLANRMTEAIAADVRETGPIQTGLLRILAHAEPAVVVGEAAVGRMVSSRPSDDGRNDVAVWVEFGTRYMTPRRYSAASSRRAVSRLGYGRFVQTADPWPHK